jgi:hypothetical protein
MAGRMAGRDRRGSRRKKAVDLLEEDALEQRKKEVMISALHSHLIVFLGVNCLSYTMERWGFSPSFRFFLLILLFSFQIGLLESEILSEKVRSLFASVRASLCLILRCN